MRRICLRVGSCAVMAGTRWSPCTRPSRRTSTRSAMASASSTAWVTSKVVGLCSANNLRSSACIEARVSASRAPNGSSRSRTSGRRASALARETRWAWPPDSVSGQRSARSASSTCSRAVRAFARVSSQRSRPRTTLRHTRRQGSSRGSWNATLTLPLTVREPVMAWSRPANRRSSVDLPEPLRPSRATTWPAAMSRSRPARTGAWPYDLLIARSAIAGVGGGAVLFTGAPARRVRVVRACAQRCR